MNDESINPSAWAVSSMLQTECVLGPHSCFASRHITPSCHTAQDPAVNAGRETNAAQMTPQSHLTR